ncbi:MAG TPA: FecR domain-containing protein [Mucilaginibacter sp.]|jgi:ferric-dicitrate binding protein FerR (iron transport regulator)
MELMDMHDDILISYLLGEASAEEVRQVDEWRWNDEACNKRLEEFRLLWETSATLWDTQEDDAPAALSRFRAKAERRKAKTAVFTLKPVYRWLSAAASLLLVAGAIWLYTLQHRVTRISLVTKTETQTIGLPDGSVITLNHRSLFEYPSKFKGDQRQVKLTSGEAFFNIAHDQAKPFVITAGKTLIRVVGTSFNVKIKKGDVEVIVESGVVEISNNGRVIRLTPGEKAWVSKNSKTMKKEQNTDQLYTYYRTKEFEAENTPLWRVVEVLNEAYDSHIVIARKELMNMPLNTTFKNESLDNVLDVISRTFKITVIRNGETILLK